MRKLGCWTIQSCVALALSFLMLSVTAATAQTISYADAGDRIAMNCGQDIEKYCKNVNLGGGRIQNCLIQNEAKVSAACKATNREVRALLQKRAAARAGVMKICDADVRRLCGLVQPGDGNILECMLIAQRSVSARCNQAITDAGYR